jgi:hypothetical protein
MKNPPGIAETLLRAMLPPASVETMTGDLLEEYRDRRVPSVGRLRADFWYARQVGSVFLHRYGWFAAPLILVPVIHDLFNTFRDATGAAYLNGAPVQPGWPPVVGAAVLLVAAMYGTLRTGRWVGGVVATFGLFVVCWLFMVVWWMATLYPFAQVQQHNPYWIQAWQWSIHRPNQGSLFGFNPDTPGESFLAWMFWDNIGGLIFLGLAMAVISSVCGIVGSTMSWTYRLLRRQDAA